MKFEDGLQVFNKRGKWEDMTRDDTCKLFYNLFYAMEGNYAYPSEDDEDYDEELDELFADVDEENIYSKIIVDIKD